MTRSLLLLALVGTASCALNGTNTTTTTNTTEILMQYGFVYEQATCSDELAAQLIAIEAVALQDADVGTALAAGHVCGSIHTAHQVGASSAQFVAAQGKVDSIANAVNTKIAEDPVLAAQAGTATAAVRSLPRASTCTVPNAARTATFTINNESVCGVLECNAGFVQVGTSECRPATTTTTTTPDDDLNGGQITAIVLCLVAVVVAGGVAAYFVLGKKQAAAVAHEPIDEEQQVQTVVEKANEPVEEEAVEENPQN